MYHVFTDIRVSRRLTAHVITDENGEIVGQFREIFRVLECLHDREAFDVEFHGPAVVYRIRLTGIADVSQDARSLGKGFELAPWNEPSQTEG